jgi:hypothetical protein
MIHSPAHRNNLTYLPSAKSIVVACDVTHVVSPAYRCLITLSNKQYSASNSPVRFSPTKHQCRLNSGTKILSVPQKNKVFLLAHYMGPVAQSV